MAYFLALAVISGLVVALMRRLGTLDVPGSRSSHTRPTPKGGGVGIIAACLAGAAGAHWAGWPVDGRLWAALLAAAALGAFSHLDDARSFPAWAKLAAQCAAAAAVLAGGLGLKLAWFGLLPSPLQAPACLAAGFAWLLFVTNAVNFIDGLNGLASGAVGLAALFAAVLAGARDQAVVQSGGLLLAAGIAGFLPFNFPRGRIFMGDVGSQFIGLMIGAIALAAAGGVDGAGPGPGVAHGAWAAALIPFCLAGILADVAVTLLRRALMGERLMQAHRGHFYQVAQRSLMGAVPVTLVHWGMVVWGAWLWEVSAVLQFSASPQVFLMLLLPQAAWFVRVAVAAREAALGRW